MDQQFNKQQALRIRELAEKADPFTRERLLKLAERYDLAGGNPSQATRMMSRPLASVSGPARQPSRGSSISTNAS